MEEMVFLVNRVNLDQWGYLVIRVILAHRDQWYSGVILYCMS